MYTRMPSLHKWLIREEGMTQVEYGLIFARIAVVGLLAVIALRSSTGSAFDQTIIAAAGLLAVTALGINIRGAYQEVLDSVGEGRQTQAAASVAGQMSHNHFNQMKGQ